jgi:phage shock protein PspC (stress-responsive transcriptional regulator)
MVWLLGLNVKGLSNMFFTTTINLWWVLTPFVVFLMMTLLLTLIFAFLMCRQADDKWYTFRKIVFSIDGAKTSWYWFLRDILYIRKG